MQVFLHIVQPKVRQDNNAYHFRRPGDIGPGFSLCSETIICTCESPVTDTLWNKCFLIEKLHKRSYWSFVKSANFTGRWKLCFCRDGSSHVTLTICFFTHVKTEGTLSGLLTLTGSIESNIRDLLLCAAAGCCSMGWVADRCRVAKHGVCWANDGARLSNRWTNNGAGWSHGQAPLPGHVGHPDAWSCCKEEYSTYKVSDKTWINTEYRRPSSCLVSLVGDWILETCVSIMFMTD